MTFSVSFCGYGASDGSSYTPEATEAVKAAFKEFAAKVRAAGFTASSGSIGGSISVSLDPEDLGGPTN